MTSHRNTARRRGPMAICGLAVALSLLATERSVHAETARELYLAAHGREQSVRMTLESDAATVGVLPEVRAVVLAYQALVKQYPASGYADDALWQAGRLSVDAFLRFGQARDRAAGTRLLKALVAGYPTSKLVKRVPEEI